MGDGGMPSGLTKLTAWRAAVRRVRAAYIKAHGRAPDLVRPRRFSEKMQWRKLFDLDPRYAIFCDKLATRRFIADRLGEAVLPPLLWSGAPDEIPFDRLAPPYVLKSTHGSGHVVMVTADDVADREAMRAQGGSWLGRDHGAEYDEPGYSAVPRLLLVERAVTGPAGERPTEVRFFLFDGEIAVINTVFIEDGRVRNGAFHRPDWTRLDWHFTRFVDRPFPPPHHFKEMARMARLLGAGFDHIRIDFYDGGERFWVGEMTLYSWSGHVTFNPDEADFALGDAWRLRRPFRRAAMTVLRQAPGILTGHVPGNGSGGAPSIASGTTLRALR
jgi:hypothetical protein